MRTKTIVTADDLSQVKFYQFVSLHKQVKDFDVIIIGASYAGLAAAITLGRALRKVLIIDNGNPFYNGSDHKHHFITQNKETDAITFQKAKEDALKYKTVRFIKDRIETVAGGGKQFTVETKRNEKFYAKKILFSTEVIDMIPGIPGFAACWGVSVFHCLYCHAYEVADTDIGIIANGDIAFELVKLLYNWSRHIMLFTNGVATLTEEQMLKVNEKNVILIEKEIESLDHKRGQIKNIVLKNGKMYPVNAIFCKLSFLQATDIPQKQLGCELTPEGFIKTDMFQRTSVNGVYATDANTIMSRTTTVSAATGAVTGMHINLEIIDETF